MKVALLGFPQSGKRTLFSLLTGHGVPPGRKEGEAVEGIARVWDPRVDAIAAIAKPQRIKYADVVYVLCPDVPAEGGGKRDWLDHARRCDAIAVLIRAFTAAEVYHPRGSVDAMRDRRDMAAELLLADLAMVETRLERLGKEKRAGQTPAQAQEERVLIKCREALENEKWLNAIGLEPHELQVVRSLGFLTLMPIVWVDNVDEDQLSAQAAGRLLFSCKIEQEISAMEAADRQAFLKELGLESSGVDRMNAAAYDALGQMSFYTMGPDEVRAWTVRKGTAAPQAAGKIHTDIERGFIRVEVIRYEDLMAAGSEHALKEQGKTQLKGKDYVIQDGDICEFRFNV